MIKIPDINVHDFYKYFRECMFEKDGELYYFERMEEGVNEEDELTLRDVLATKLNADSRIVAKFGDYKRFTTEDIMGDLNVFQFPDSMGWRSAFNGKFLGHYRYSANGGRARGFNSDAFNCWTAPESLEIMMMEGMDYESLTHNIGSAYWMLKRPEFVPLRSGIHEMLEGRRYGAAVSPSIALMLSGSFDSATFPIKLFVDRKVVGKVDLSGNIVPVSSGLAGVLECNLKKVA